MKKHLLLLAMAVPLFAGCGANTEIVKAEIVNGKKIIAEQRLLINGNEHGRSYLLLATVVFDSCEYVVCEHSYGLGITHKGKCKYCARKK